MTPKRKRRVRSESRAKIKDQGRSKAEHLHLLEQLELTDSCCDICHCDCYSSHSSGSASGRGNQRQASVKELLQLENDIQTLEKLQRRESTSCHRSASRSPTERKFPHSRRGSFDGEKRSASSGRTRRSKSAGSRSCESREKQPAQKAQQIPQDRRKRRAQKDCKMLQVSSDARKKVIRMDNEQF